MRYVYGALLFIVGVVIHWVWCTYFSFFGAAPQVLLVLTVAVAAEVGPISGQHYAFAWGLLWDSMGVHLFGVHALCLTLVGYSVGTLRRQMDVTTPVSQAAVGGIVTAAYFLLIGLVGFLFERRFYWVGWKEFALAPVLNALVAPACFSAAQRWLGRPARP